MITWELLYPHIDVGLLPEMLDPRDPRSAAVQIDANYSHGGGWHSFKGFKLTPEGNLQYPDDPPRRALATAKLRDERIILFEGDWVAVIQPDGSMDVARID